MVYSMAGNVFNPILWPDKLVDFHVPDCITGLPPRQCKRRDIMTSNDGRLTPDVTRVSLPETRAA
jgi:hypothetical protein